MPRASGKTTEENRWSSSASSMRRNPPSPTWYDLTISCNMCYKRYTNTIDVGGSALHVKNLDSYDLRYHQGIIHRISTKQKTSFLDSISLWHKQNYLHPVHASGRSLPPSMKPANEHQPWTIGNRPTINNHWNCDQYDNRQYQHIGEILHQQSELTDSHNNMTNSGAGWRQYEFDSIQLLHNNNHSKTATYFTMQSCPIHNLGG